jgi:hypothetical protein
VGGLPERALERLERDEEHLEAHGPRRAADEPRGDRVDVLEQNRPPEQHDAGGEAACDGLGEELPHDSLTRRARIDL